MAWHLLGAKPLPKPMLTCSQLNPKENISMKFCVKSRNFRPRKSIWKCCLQNLGHIYSGLIPSSDVNTTLGICLMYYSLCWPHCGDVSGDSGPLFWCHETWTNMATHWGDIFEFIFLFEKNSCILLIQISLKYILWGFVYKMWEKTKKKKQAVDWHWNRYWTLSKLILIITKDVTRHKGTTCWFIEPSQKCISIRHFWYMFLL